MGLGVQYVYSIRTGGDTTLGIQELNNKENGPLRYDILEYID